MRRFPAAVAAGNVETSQRIVDVLLKAFARAIPERVPAASSGTMNNLTLGGIDPRNGAIFSYYETIAGGMGACSSADGRALSLVFALLMVPVAWWAGRTRVRPAHRLDLGRAGRTTPS